MKKLETIDVFFNFWRFLETFHASHFGICSGWSRCRIKVSRGL